MKNFSLVAFSVDHPKLVMVLAIAITVIFAMQFPKMKIDTNPKNMLPKTSDVRMWNDEVDSTFSLYEDTIVLGISNETGILNRDTLGKIQRITDKVVTISGVAARDVSSFTTIDNVTVEDGILKVAPLMQKVPETDEEMQALRKTLRENPLFMNRIISMDEKTTAIYTPLEPGANGKEIADQIRAIVNTERGSERYYIAGDPVARDTFGSVMFKLMAMFSPISALIMFIAIYLMFRSVVLSLSMLSAAMISIIWSMGLLIGIGFPIHIMSSMAPVFLIAIATDGIHIFNEFYFRYREKKNKRTAILETMEVVGRPVRYTALATAAGFAVLIFMHIIPVRIFGGLIAIGTIILRLLSFSFIPAILALIKDEKIEKAAAREHAELNVTGRLLRSLSGFGVLRPRATASIAVVLLVFAVIGASQIVVNNNMVTWFKKGSEIRTADTLMNRTLGGTSLGYVVAISNDEDYIKTPEAMRNIEGLQKHLEKLPVVGKTTSVVDYVKRINRV
ncbi:MAG: MMPL family transporter, partial [Acidobacteriota bacterium]